MRVSIAGRTVFDGASMSAAREMLNYGEQIKRLLDGADCADEAWTRLRVTPIT